VKRSSSWQTSRGEGAKMADDTDQRIDSALDVIVNAMKNDSSL
jgi:hypothetical protein